MLEKDGREKEILNIRVEICKIENRKTIEKINKTKCFFKKINKIALTGVTQLVGTLSCAPNGCGFRSCQSTCLGFVFYSQSGLVQVFYSQSGLVQEAIG